MINEKMLRTTFGIDCVGRYPLTERAHLQCLAQGGIDHELA
jgi:hypothetical protein